MSAQTTMLVTAHSSVTLMSRILQILSRRGCVLIGLETEAQDNDLVILRIVVEVPDKWQGSLAGLLTKLVDIEHIDITKETTS